MVHGFRQNTPSILDVEAIRNQHGSKRVAKFGAVVHPSYGDLAGPYQSLGNGQMILSGATHTYESGVHFEPIIEITQTKDSSTPSPYPQYATLF